MEKQTKTPPLAILYLVALSAIVTYFYDVYLGKAQDYHQFDNDEMFQPTEEQMARARELGLRDRLLATTKEIWPECAAQSMSAIECKYFIDDEILRLFTDEDKFIRTRIVGKRTSGDEWYNAVVITMDDNDFALGKDGDGWIYYTFQWEGSGTEATAQQQTDIPPVTAEETRMGAIEGSSVQTLYTPDCVAAPPPLEPITTVPSVVTGENVPFDYSVPPLVVEPEPYLVEGATTDGAIAGVDGNPLNGGVVLDGEAASSGEGHVRLELCLNEPPTIAAAGLRTIGPFDCREMTGFDCCLSIKHMVRDADIHGKAIQCHLDYDESTCKKKWWLATDTSKKVLIHANHNEMVSLDPVISGAWPQCDDKWGQNRDWSTKYEGRCGKDFGDTLCPEGQCCSAWGHCGIGGAWCDFGCQSQCWATSDTSGLVVQERCGAVVGGKICHGTYCCSSSGYCGSGANYCEKDNGCQSGCWGGGVEEIPPQIPDVCKGTANVCIALDMSGSVCSKDFSNPSQCTKCDWRCRDWNLDQNTCCPNFKKIKGFAADVINWINHLQFGVNSRSLSLVTFSGSASTKVQLGQDVLAGVDGLDYTGGLTNHGAAINHCKSTFDGSSADSQNFILLVTDGVATSKNGSFNTADGIEHGKNRANVAKEAGITIETVFINPAQAEADVISYMNELSSSGSHFDVSDFENLGKTVNDIAYKIACSGDGRVTPAAAPELQPVSAAAAGLHYCDCSTCTESVMNSYAGLYTCKGRIDWLKSYPRNKSEHDACATVYSEFPDICKCSPTCDY